MIGMFKAHFFVNLIMLLQTGAVFDYALQRKWLHTAYWLLGLLTNLVVTYGLKK
jgi:hypothetical protein